MSRVGRFKGNAPPLERTTTIKTLVIGVGNILLSDEGVGVRVAEKLAADFQFPDNVQILDGGTLGMDLVCYLDGVQNLLLIDAVETGREAGSLIRLEGDEVPSFLSVKISPHQVGIPDMLFAAKLTGVYPQNIVLLGVQPACMDVGLDLSPVVAGQVDTLVDQAVEQLGRWGVSAI
ncbi:MAG: HyaD/HybD family hydrogenase maturation endopeptidase [Anaerolineales bacterium]|nr:HyaD/HybD family hydrogenase maturation endopeptidase [Anaerolineales bacterium]